MNRVHPTEVCSLCGQGARDGVTCIYDFIQPSSQSCRAWNKMKKAERWSLLLVVELGFRLGFV